MMYARAFPIWMCVCVLYYCYVYSGRGREYWMGLREFENEMFFYHLSNLIGSGNWNKKITSFLFFIFFFFIKLFYKKKSFFFLLSLSIEWFSMMSLFLFCHFNDDWRWMMIDKLYYVEWWFFFCYLNDTTNFKETFQIIHLTNSHYH